MQRFHAAAQIDAMTRRRLGWIWGLLFVDVLTYTPAATLVHIPSVLGKLITQGALVVALGIALTINRRLVVRPNGFLLLLTVFCGLSLIMSAHGYFGFGSIVRAVRLTGFVLTLWLLTPWWGRDDLFFPRMHRRALSVIMASVVVGLILAPGKAFAQAGGGRLGGALWGITPTQVAHYSAVFVGLSIVMWFTGLLSPRQTLLVGVLGSSMLLLTHTRTAVIGLMVGVLVAGLSLFFSRKRVRRAFLYTLLVAGLIALSFAPFISKWFTRGENGQQLNNLSGRGAVWSALVHEPRSEVNTLFGFGMSNDSYGGLPIDSSWLSVYQAQGLVGDAIIAVAVVLLLLIALLAPRGPGRAMALFLIVYCAIASYTETGLGNASPYLLDLSVAMSVLMPHVVSDRAAVRRGGRDRSDLGAWI
jgi:hypothetical protein